MRSALPLLVLLVGSACAQTAQPSPPDLVEITPETVIATVNGQKFTAGDLERITQNLEGSQRKLAGTDPKRFLEQYALAITLQDEARKMKLHEAAPYRARIEATTRDILVNGAIAEKRNQIAIPVEELRKAYESDKAGYQQARVKIIFVTRQGYSSELATGKSKDIKPDESREKAGKVAKLAREGKDFAALAKEFSDDRTTADAGADFPFPIRANSTNVPENIRKPLLAAKAGDIVGPIEHNTGFYVFRVDTLEQASFDSVKEEIEKNLRQGAVNRWIGELQKKSTVTLDHDSFWKTFLAANQEQQEKAKQAGGSK